jgi:hypothetical protein
MILLGIALHALGGIAAATCYISQKRREEMVLTDLLDHFLSGGVVSHANGCLGAHGA